MYSKEFEKSLKAVEAAREDNIALAVSYTHLVRRYGPKGLYE